MLIQLIYISTPTTPTLESTKAFVPVAKRNNDSLDITGMILSDDNAYIQVLEGEQEDVDGLFEKISKDPRHTAVRLLRYSSIPKREFQTWSMRHVRVPKLTGLSEHDAIQLLYIAADQELGKKSVRTILYASVTFLCVVVGIVFGGPFAESRFAPALKNVAGGWLEITPTKAVVLVTGTRVRKSCHLDGFFVSSKTQVGMLLAHSKILEVSPENNERFVAKLETYPPSEEYKIEIRHSCQPLWSQAQKIEMELNQGSEQTAEVRLEKPPS